MDDQPIALLQGPSVTIDDEFHALIPSLSDEERTQWEENLRAEGCRDPLVTWRGLLLDGHHRLAICTQYGLACTTVELDLPDRLAARIWIIRNQLGRRNLNKAQRCALGEQLEAAFAEQARAREYSGKAPDPRLDLPQGKTSDQVAGVSGSTYSHYKAVKNQAPQEVTTAMVAGDLAIDTAYQQVRRGADGRNAQRPCVTRRLPPRRPLDAAMPLRDPVRRPALALRAQRERQPRRGEPVPDHAPGGDLRAARPPCAPARMPGSGCRFLVPPRPGRGPRRHRPPLAPPA